MCVCVHWCTHGCTHCTWVGDYDSLSTTCGYYRLSEVIKLHLYINNEQDWGIRKGEGGGRSLDRDTPRRVLVTNMVHWEYTPVCLEVHD